MDFGNIIRDYLALDGIRMKILNEVVSNVLNEFINFLVYIENSEKYYLFENNYLFKKLILSLQPNYYLGKVEKDPEHLQLLNIMKIQNFFKNKNFEILICSFARDIIKISVIFSEHARKCNYNDIEYFIKLYYNIQNLNINYLEDLYNQQIKLGKFVIHFGQIDQNFCIIGDPILNNNIDIKKELEHYYEQLYSENYLVSNNVKSITNMDLLGNDDKEDSDLDYDTDNSHDIMLDNNSVNMSDDYDDINNLSDSEEEIYDLEMEFDDMSVDKN